MSILKKLIPKKKPFSKEEMPTTSTSLIKIPLKKCLIVCAKTPVCF